MLKIVSVFVLVALSVYGLSALSHAESLTIQKVVITGDAGVDEVAVRETALALMNGKYLYLFSRRNAYFFPSDAIQQTILEKNPQIAKALLVHDNLQKLEIHLVEREPKYLWCGHADTHRAASEKGSVRVQDENCFFIDKNGMVFAKASDFSDGVYIKFYGPIDPMGEKKKDDLPQASKSARTLARKYETVPHSPIRKHFLNEAKLRNTQITIASLETYGVHTRRVIYEKSGTVKLVTTEGYEIRYRIDQTPEDVVKKLMTILRSDEFHGAKKAEKIEAIQYFDLRYGNRVFYK